MRAVLSERFARAFIAAPPEVHKAFGKQLAHLLRDLRHRSLDAKKFPESGDPDFGRPASPATGAFTSESRATPTTSTRSNRTPNDRVS